VCCNVLQCVAVCCRVFQSAERSAVCCNMLQCVASCCNALQCVVVCCSLRSVVQCVAHVLQRVAVCCKMLQCVAASCRVVQCLQVTASPPLSSTASSIAFKALHLLHCLQGTAFKALPSTFRQILYLLHSLSPPHFYAPTSLPLTGLYLICFNFTLLYLNTKFFFGILVSSVSL